MPDDSENITDNTLWQITSQQLYLQSDFTLSESHETDPAKRLRIDNIGGALYDILGRKINEIVVPGVYLRRGRKNPPFIKIVENWATGYCST